MTTVWVNGGLVDGAAPSVPALDHGLTVGDGVFETLLVDGGAPYALTRHLRRLARSAEIIGLTLPADGQLRRAVAEALAGYGSGHGRLRLTVTDGLGPLGSDRGGAAPTVIVGVSPVSWPDDVRAVSVPWTRNERSSIAGAKTTSYAENVVALDAAHRQGAHEALLANSRGELCEGTGSNVLVVLDGDLLTPPLGSGCLAGITRELLLEWAGQEGLPVVEKDVPFGVLAEADDVLLTSSTRGVQAVSHVDGRKLAGSELGRAAAELYARRAKHDGIDP